MRLLALLLKIVLFLLLLGFAAKNSETVNVRYFLGLDWQAPLSLVMLVVFALGVLFGLFGCSRRLFRLQREASRLRAAAGRSNPAGPG